MLVCHADRGIQMAKGFLAATKTHQQTQASAWECLTASMSDEANATKAPQPCHTAYLADSDDQVATNQKAGIASSCQLDDGGALQTLRTRLGVSDVAAV